MELSRFKILAFKGATLFPLVAVIRVSVAIRTLSPDTRRKFSFRTHGGVCQERMLYVRTTAESQCSSVTPIGIPRQNIVGSSERYVLQRVDKLCSR